MTPQVNVKDREIFRMKYSKETPEEETPKGETPEEETPEEETPEEETPEEETPKGETPEEETPKEEKKSPKDKEKSGKEPAGSGYPNIKKLMSALENIKVPTHNSDLNREAKKLYYMMSSDKVTVRKMLEQLITFITTWKKVNAVDREALKREKSKGGKDKGPKSEKSEDKEPKTKKEPEDDEEKADKIASSNLVEGLIHLAKENPDMRGDLLEILRPPVDSLESKIIRYAHENPKVRNVLLDVLESRVVLEKFGNRIALDVDRGTVSTIIHLAYRLPTYRTELLPLALDLIKSPNFLKEAKVKTRSKKNKGPVHSRSKNKRKNRQKKLRKQQEETSNMTSPKAEPKKVDLTLPKPPEPEKGGWENLKEKTTSGVKAVGKKLYRGLQTLSNTLASPDNPSAPKKPAAGPNQGSGANTPKNERPTAAERTRGSGANAPKDQLANLDAKVKATQEEAKAAQKAGDLTLYQKFKRNISEMLDKRKELADEEQKTKLDAEKEKRKTKKQEERIKRDKQMAKLKEEQENAAALAEKQRNQSGRVMSGEAPIVPQNLQERGAAQSDVKKEDLIKALMEAFLRALATISSGKQKSSGNSAAKKAKSAVKSFEKTLTDLFAQQDESQEIQRAGGGNRNYDTDGTEVEKDPDFLRAMNDWEGLDDRAWQSRSDDSDGLTRRDDRTPKDEYLFPFLEKFGTKTEKNPDTGKKVSWNTLLYYRKFDYIPRDSGYRKIWPKANEKAWTWAINEHKARGFDAEEAELQLNGIEATRKIERKKKIEEARKGAWSENKTSKELMKFDRETAQTLEGARNSIRAGAKERADKRAKEGFWGMFTLLKDKGYEAEKKQKLKEQFDRQLDSVDSRDVYDNSERALGRIDRALQHNLFRHHMASERSRSIRSGALQDPKELVTTLIRLAQSNPKLRDKVVSFFSEKPKTRPDQVVQNLIRVAHRKPALRPRIIPLLQKMAVREESLEEPSWLPNSLVHLAHKNPELRSEILSILNG